MPAPHGTSPSPVDRQPTSRAGEDGELHSLLVRVPRTLFSVCFVFDLLSLLGGHLLPAAGRVLVLAARFLVAAGIVTWLLAVVVGWMDPWVRAGFRRGAARPVAVARLAAGGVALGAFAGSFAVRGGDPGARATSPLAALLAALGLIALALATYLGVLVAHRIGEAAAELPNQSS